MPRDGAIIFRDIVGKLAILRITCDKCGRSGQYHVCQSACKIDPPYCLTKNVTE
jgi:hypothetical protein